MDFTGMVTFVDVCLCLCRESESKQLKEQIDVMMDTIQREEVRTAQLEQRCKLFGFGKNKPEDQVRKQCVHVALN